MNKPNLSSLIKHANRGILLDLIVFVFNSILMIALSGQLRQLFREANQESGRAAKVATIVFCLGLVFLMPIGALLKRRHAHLRRIDLNHVPAGCITLGAYFLTQLVFLIGAAGLAVELAYPRNTQTTSADYFGLPPLLFTTLFLGVPAIAILNSFIVWFYFYPPRRVSLLPWLETAQAERLGDLLLFLNMIGFQAFWVLLMSDLINDYPTIFGRISMFVFAALLIYIPPRLFFLAEDGSRPIVWLTMFLANSPILLRIIISTSTTTGPSN